METVRPVSKVGWDANQDSLDGVSKILNNSRRPHCQLGILAAPDHTKHAIEDGSSAKELRALSLSLSTSLLRPHWVGGLMPQSQDYPTYKKTQDIPELDYGVDSSVEVAVPPRVSSQRVPTMKELENNMPYILPYILDGNIDLRPLISVLTPVSQVADDDELWDPDTLLRELEFKENADKQNNLPSTFANVTIN